MRWSIAPITFLLLLVASPAVAQEGVRDPFVPLITEQQVSEVPSSTSPTTTEPTTTQQPAPTTPGSSANTGMEASDLTTLAAMLIGLGAAALIVARLRRPLVAVPRRPSR
jgi:hypothetical protein